MSRYNKPRPKTIMSGRVRHRRQTDGSEAILLASLLILLSFIFN